MFHARVKTVPTENPPWILSYVQHVYLRLPLQVEFPPLAAYRLEFGEPEPDPEEVQNDTFWELAYKFSTVVELYCQFSW